MQSRWVKSFIYILFFLLAQSVKGYCKVSITGPLCVVAGTEYQYNIIRTGTDTSNIQLCITGGVIAGTASTCRSGSVFSFIRIVWKDTTAGVITINTAAGNVFVNVNMTKGLLGGKIDSSTRMQFIKADSVPSSIRCPAATGGHCSPVYIYQWQQSVNGMSWQDITGAASQHLYFSSVLTQAMHYRRKVRESASGSESFSNTAIVMITAKTLR